MNIMVCLLLACVLDIVAIPKIYVFYSDGFVLDTCSHIGHKMANAYKSTETKATCMISGARKESHKQCKSEGRQRFIEVQAKSSLEPAVTHDESMYDRHRCELGTSLIRS